MGVIPNPEIKKYEIVENDILLVVASDGVWEFLSNEEVSEIALSYYSKGAAEASANHIVRSAA